MKRNTIALALCLLSTPALAVTSDTFTMPRPVGTISAHKPAFLSIEDTRMSTGKSLMVSSFNAFGADSLSMLENVGSLLANLGAAQVTDLGSMRWPNEAHMAPAGFIAEQGVQPDLLVVAGGFLVPGKATGAILIMKPNGGAQFKITADKPGYFYHRTAFLDMNGDGRLDVVTARANKPVFGAPQGELLWLEQPATGALQGAWKEHLLAQGPDVYFRIADVDANGTPEIIAAQFFTKKLSLWWKEGPEYKGRVIDADIGAAYDVEVVDLNADGKLDLLATNHEAGSGGAVYAYEIPADVKSGTFKRHTLLEGIETRQGGFNQGSPGSAVSFFPSKDATGKPALLLSGDGSQRAHLLVADSEMPSSWKYQEHELVDAGSTVGMSAVGDVDGDGKAEIFVPAYDRDIIHVFSFGKK